MNISDPLDFSDGVTITNALALVLGAVTITRRNDLAVTRAVVDLIKGDVEAAKRSLEMYVDDASVSEEQAAFREAFEAISALAKRLDGRVNG